MNVQADQRSLGELQPTDAVTAELVRTATRFAVRHIEPQLAGDDHEGRKLPDALFELGVQTGFDRIALAEELGGAGQGMAPLCAVVQTLASTCAGHALSIGIHGATLAAMAEQAGETPKAAAERVAESGRAVAISLAEAETHKSVHLDLRVSRRSGATMSLSGLLPALVQLDPDGFALLFARDEQDRWLALLVPCSRLSALELTPETSLGLRAVPMARVEVADQDVPTDTILSTGSAAEKLYWTLLRYQCLVASAGASGLMQQAYQTALAYAAERYQGGRNIIDHSHLRSILGAMATQSATSAGMLRQATSRVHDDRLVLATKGAITDNAVQLCTNAVQLLGGYGYMKEYGVEKALRDAAVLALFPLANTRVRLLLAALDASQFGE